jgi:hypothetical protein
VAFRVDPLEPLRLVPDRLGHEADGQFPRFIARMVPSWIWTAGALIAALLILDRVGAP